MFQIKIVEETTAHILCSVPPPSRNSWHLWDNVEKYCRAGHATDDNI